MYLTETFASCSKSSRVARAPALKILLTLFAFLPISVRQSAARSRARLSGSCMIMRSNMSQQSCSKTYAYQLQLLHTCNRLARVEVMPQATHCSWENLELSSWWAADRAFCRMSKSEELSCMIWQTLEPVRTSHAPEFYCADSKAYQFDRSLSTKSSGDCCWRLSKQRSLGLEVIYVF